MGLANITRWTTCLFAVLLLGVGLDSNVLVGISVSNRRYVFVLNCYSVSSLFGPPLPFPLEGSVSISEILASFHQHGEIRN